MSEYKITGELFNDSEADKFEQSAQSTLEKALNKTFKTLRRKTGALRLKSERSRAFLANMSSNFVNAQDSIKSLIGEKGDETDFRELSMKALMSEIGVFITETKTAKDEGQVKTLASRLLGWTKNLGLVGVMEDENFSNFMRNIETASSSRGGIGKGLVTNSEKAALKERLVGSKEAKLILDETFLNEKTTHAELKEKALNLVIEKLEDFVENINQQESKGEEELDNITNTALGIKFSSLLNAPGVLLSKGLTFTVAFFYNKSISPGGGRQGTRNIFRSFKKSNVVGFKSRYALYKVVVKAQNTSFISKNNDTDAMYNLSIDISTDETRKYDTGQESAKKLFTTQTSGSIYNPSLNNEIKKTLQGSPIFEFGHIVSLSQRQMEDIVATLKKIDNGLDNTYKETKIYKNFKILLGNIEQILKVAQKIDSIFSDWIGSDELINGRDVVEFVQNHIKGDIEARVIFVKKEAGKITSTGAIKELRQTFTANPEIQIKEDMRGTLEGMMEPKKVNRIKGALQLALKGLMLKQLRQDLTKDIKEITEEQILALLLKRRSDSPLESVIKNAFPGTKIKRGKTTRLSKSTVKESIGKSSAKKLSISKKRTKVSSINISTKPPVEKSSSSSKTISVNSQVTPTKKLKTIKNDTNLINVVNSQVGEEVKNLLRYPRLVNRTGRFASSVKITTMSGREVTFSYQRNPYSVFDKNYGSAPWNSISSRDPYDTISKAITKILRRYDRVYASQVIIREG